MRGIQLARQGLIVVGLTVVTAQPAVTAAAERGAVWQDPQDRVWRNADGQCWRDPDTEADDGETRCPDSTSVDADESAGDEPAPAPSDSDGDGVNDGQDACPGTEAGVAVDQRGCALDSDGDTVADARDDCPGTPAGAKVDDAGCEVVVEEDITREVALEFAFDSAEVQPRYYAEVERIAELLRRYPSADVEIAGHTDSVGSRRYNQQLSERRAGAVVELLVSRFDIERQRLDAVGYGESRPRSSNDTPAGRDDNRRVEATIKAAE